MADNLRFGLEMEFHGIVLTFRKKRDPPTDPPHYDYWPDPPDETLVGENAILVPFNDATFSIDGRTNWESDWGFRAVGDRFGPATVFGESAGTCILELATAANVVENFSYWTSVRLCTQELAAVIADCKISGKLKGAIADPNSRCQWFPLDTFVNEYNRRVDKMKDREGFDKSKFKFKNSTDVRNLAVGEFVGQWAKNWEGLISTNHESLNPMNGPWCDIQINYQVDLEWLYEQSEDWIGLWNSMWANKYSASAPEFDPKIGHPRVTPLTEIVRTQVFAALWRSSKVMAEQLTADIASSPALPKVRALVTYLMAAGAINVESVGGSTPKNSFPQLPKTSPASIARLIAQIHPGSTQLLQRLATDPHMLTEVRSRITHGLRSVRNLVGDPGNLSPLSPWEGGCPYPDYQDTMLTGIFNPHFDAMWLEGLSPVGTALNPATNLSGFTSAAPFYVPWADGIKTSYPAARSGDHGVKMLFEGRYGSDKLNIGFNPYVEDFMFNRSYLSMVRALAPDSAKEATAAIQKMFPDKSKVTQNFPVGFGPH